MLVHSVFFYLKPDLAPEDIATFEAKAMALSKIPQVAHGWLGKPAPTGNRPVIDTTYSYGFTVVFKSIADHDSYQVDPIHLDFLKHCAKFWTTVKIYDAE